MGPCPPPQQLLQFLNEEPDAAGQEALREHVERCPACQKALDDLARAGEPDWSGVRTAEKSPEAEAAFLDELTRSPPADWGIPAWAVETTALSKGSPAHRPGAIPDYELLEELGRGGMGVVYRARQLALNRVVALKMILAGDHVRTEDLVRFRTEAVAPARLKHPNIIQVHEVGEHEGRPYFSMELADGGSLAQHLHGVPVSAREAAALVATLADAVHYAHEQGIVHRDLKPANVLLFHDGRAPAAGLLARWIPKVGDFGLARRLGDAGHTQSGAILGTPSYMAPEQARDARVGPLADIYALGAILYELITGRPPVVGENLSDILQQLRHEDPLPPRRLQPLVPRDLETICLKCLEKDPVRRYAGGRELAQDLRRFLADEPVSARPPSLLYQCRKFARRHRALVGSLLGVFLALVLGAVVSLLFAFSAARQRGAAEESARQADAARHEALHEAYYARLRAAQASLNEHDAGQARQQLDAAPEEFRRWEWSYLHSRLDESIQRLEAPPGVRWTGIGYGRTGWFALGCSPRGPELWDVASGRRLALLADGKDLTPVALPTRSGTRFLLCHPSGSLRLVDETGQAIQTFEASPTRGSAAFAALSSPGRHLAVIFGGQINSVHIFDVASSEELACWSGNGFPRGNPAFSPDGSLLTTGDNGGYTEIYAPVTLEVDRMAAGHDGPVSFAAFSPDGRQVVTGSQDQTLRQWDVQTARLLRVRSQTSAILAGAISPDGRWVATSGADGAVRLWPAAEGEPVAVWHGHSSLVTRLSFNPQSEQLATADEREVRLWDVGGGDGLRVLRDHTSYVYAVACSPDGRWIASGGWDKVVRLWDAASGEPVAALPGHSGWVAALVFSPDGRRLVSWDSDGPLRVYDVPTGRALAVLPHRPAYWPAWTHALAISPDGTTLVAGHDRGVRFWNLATGQERELLELAHKPVRLVVFSPDGRELAVAWDGAPQGTSGGISLVDLGTRRERLAWQDGAGVVQALAFSPDGSRLATAGVDRMVRLWDVKTGRRLRELAGHAEEVFAAAFTPDGTRLATAGRDRVIRLWDPETGEQAAQLRGHTAYVFALAFTPDGSTLVSGSGDHTVRLWDTFPVVHRSQARAAERAARPQAEQLVGRLLGELHDPAAVAERLRTSPPADDGLRRAAEHLLMRGGRTP